MLLSLSIRNLAIIDALDLEFGAGFTVLTGETGAGKSILIDAIGLAIGTRAEASLVRAGAERAEISAEFSIAHLPGISAWLSEQELLDRDAADHCVLRRVVFAEGRTRAFINDSPVSAGALRELGEKLVEVFGQNQSHSLVRADVQRGLLDGYGDHRKELEKTTALAARWSALQQQIERLGKASARDPEQLDFLRYQIRELQALNLQTGELEQLDIDHHRLANAGRLIEDGGRVLELLNSGESSVYDQLSAASQLLDGLAGVDTEFSEVSAGIITAQVQVQDGAKALQRLLDRLDLDPDALTQVEQRLSDIHDLARKHRLRADELPTRLTTLVGELKDAEQAAGGADRLLAEQGETAAAWRAAASRLTAIRSATAQRFSLAVTEVVRGLGMANAQFVVAVEADDSAAPRAQGADEVRFDFSANPGQPPRPMAKVASGGELSRLSLAIQVVGIQSGGAATMIFDEVDAGIGGGVAEIVGQQLRALGRSRQVLCVTHLAQVAAQGGAHYGIAKQVRNGMTYTQLSALDDQARVQELARMMGGVEITASTQAHARELLERGRSRS